MKKIISGICLFLVNITAIAQNKVAIQGKLNGYSNNAKIFFIYKDKVLNREIIDSVKLIQNQFYKDIYINEPTELLMIMSPKGKSFNMYSEQEKGEAEGIGFFIGKEDGFLKSEDFFKNAILDPPTKINEAYKAYRKIIYKDWPSSRDSINRHYSENGEISSKGTVSVDRDKVEEFEAALLAADQRAVGNLIAFAKANTDSYIGLLAMSTCFNANLSLIPQLLEILNNYTADLKNTVLGKSLRKEMESNSNLAEPNSTADGVSVSFMKVNVGQPAPSFKLKNPKGKSIKLNKFKGKYVLVDFWASWCKPCREENHNLKKAHNTYKDKNFTILSVSLDEKYVEWLEAITSDGLDWEQVGDMKGFKSDIALQYGIQLIPQNLLLDPKGIIIGKNLRGQALQDKLAEIL